MKKVIVLIFAVLMTITACRKSRPVLEANDSIYTTASGVTTQDIRKAIIDGCNAKKWSARDISATEIEARIIVRGKHTVIVTIPYDMNHFSINYKDSINMNYNEGKIHPNYNKWVADLEQAINVNISKITK